MVGPLSWLVVLMIAIPGHEPVALNQECSDLACVEQLEHAYRMFPEITGITVEHGDDGYLGFWPLDTFEKNERKA